MSGEKSGFLITLRGIYSSATGYRQSCCQISRWWKRSPPRLRSSALRQSSTRILTRFLLPSARLLLEDRVALAGRLLQASAILDCHSPTGVVEEAGVLQDTRSDGNAGAARAQHMRKKLLGEGDEIASQPVLTHQQPSGQPLFHLVQPIASRHVGGLQHQFLGIPLQALR